MKFVILLFIQVLLAVEERKLEENDLGNHLVNQLNDISNINSSLSGQNLLSNDMKEIGQWYDQVTTKIEDFRDQLARKLNELHTSLQRPKLPMIGLGPGLIHPYSFNVLGQKMANYPNRF